MRDALDRCSQLMKTADPSLFAPWIGAWNDAAARVQIGRRRA